MKILQEFIYISKSASYNHEIEVLFNTIMSDEAYMKRIQTTKTDTGKLSDLISIDEREPM